MTKRRARTKKTRKRRKRWIQRAIKKKGALMSWLKRGGSRIIVGATKKPVYTKSGEINTNTLRSFRKTKAYKNLSIKTKRRINLAITLEKLRRDKK